MKQMILILILVLLGLKGHSQDLPPCPAGNTTVVGYTPPVKEQVNPSGQTPPPTPPPTFPNDRLVYWIHGLGGNADSWAKAAQATQYQAPTQQVPGYPARKVTSLPLSYSEFSLSGAASTLHNTIMSVGDPACTANNITDKTINFIIAHSQGGIVSRATDQMYDNLGSQIERRFGGIVTFGTPHGGAEIINNKAQINSFSTEACAALINGPATDLIENDPLLNFIVPNQTFEQVKSIICQFLGDKILPIVFKDQLKDLGEDYKVGAPALADLNSHQNDRPKVAFYGIEEEPVFYRTMYNLRVKTPNEFDHFQADNDKFLVERFNGLIAQYQAKYLFYSDLVEMLEESGYPCSQWQWFWGYPHCLDLTNRYNSAVKKRDAWKEGYEWLRNSNQKFKAIIGANKSYFTGKYKCNCYGQEIPGEYTSCPSGCSGTQIWHIEEHPNDGVVLANSASAYPGAITKDMPRSNHQQMRNDSNTKSRLNELFFGDYGDYFQTEIR